MDAGAVEPHEYGDLPGSVAQVFAGGDGGHGRREREAGRGWESLGRSSKAQREGAPPPLRKRWRKAEGGRRKSMVTPRPRG